MFRFFKNLLGAGGGSADTRRLSHPRDLRAGDIIKFRYIDQSDVSGKEFEVSMVNTYMYGDICYPELVLKDRAGNIIYMMVEEEDGEECIALSKKIPKMQINDIICMQDMTKITSGGAEVSIRIASKPKNFEDWLANSYKKVGNSIKGSFIKGDARYISSQEINLQERFSSYTMEDDEGEYALEIEVYDTGETELGVTVYQDIGEIEDMWPANTVD